MCCTSTFSQSQPFLATFFDKTYIINVKKHFASSHLEKSRFWMYLLFMLTNFEYHPAKFQITYIWKKHSSSLIIQMLSKNVQNLCTVCHSKILRAAPYFAHLSNFKITTNTQISSKSQGFALAIFLLIFECKQFFRYCDSCLGGT